MANGSKEKAESLKDLLTEVSQIKRLLVLQLITSGVQTRDIAVALKVHPSVVSRWVPSRRVKKPGIGD